MPTKNTKTARPTTSEPKRSPEKEKSRKAGKAPAVKTSKAGKAPAVKTSKTAGRSSARTSTQTAPSTKKTVAVSKNQTKGSKQASSKKKPPQSTLARAKDAMSGRGKMIAAAVGVATAAAAGVAAFKTASGRSRSVYHLMPHDDGWQVKRPNKDKPELVRDKKREAENKARALAHDNEPSQLVIHRADGTVQTVHTYGE